MPTLTPDGYRPRLADSAIAEVLARMPAVVIEGPRGCGKTWAARNAARSEVLFDGDADARALTVVEPRLVIDGAEPRLLDEWQLAPEIWNVVRHACDESHRNGRFLLTGSAVPPDDHTRHSGAGRMARVRLRPMSLFESGESTGDVSLKALLRGEKIAAPRPDTSIEDLVEAICRGGWPRHLGISARTAQLALVDYLGEICRTDVSTVDGVRRDPAGVRRLMVSLGRNVATTASFATLAADVAGPFPLNRTTATAYLRSLERLFVVEDVPQWPTHLRSHAAVRRAAKRHFVDPSLAAAAVGAGPERLLGDLRALGFLFESLVVRDLRIYADAIGADVYHYRDSANLEVDVIVQTREGTWLAAEVKLGGPGAVEDASRGLQRLRQKVDSDRTGEFARLVVITATGYGYDRPDGVTILPITSLGP
ncbi:MAG: DUF4143 domain-containing protein [bacterium]|nr:DUF4143 domain-containing protein [bacterium]